MKKLIIAAVVMMAMCACTDSAEGGKYATIQVFDYSGKRPELILSASAMRMAKECLSVEESSL